MNVIPQIRAAIARQGWSETARRSGIDRTTLHRAFGDSMRKRRPDAHLSFATVERVLPHLGLELVVRETPR